ncbi:stage V sporulation protein AC [Brevibacillus agri]|uniref:Stage V sporulation protein AC n=1 Tax=Brevibacillus agri TaxID=51101 RepID=A0A3M8AQ01_9BACL|nr:MULTISPECIES: stage V sporulation protein AC [Brevibacillus]ELK39387.1 stage V sporulation protein AC [Brevibacillus agri BAB-2500]EJL40990.1 stage V sporulation protein AC [Brevibacillus sp. CF112]MBY0050467.1 stage V sporulation protein AC [Brevibacillus agri]MDN4091483.1 stage V sporulation protein AC [Brevibacillus agri]MDR9503038.1 stage V sporulation protein AC [Brevibacillus agri]
MATKTKSKSLGSMQMTKQLYQQQASKYQPKRNVLLNSLRAFWVGGTICLLGQVIQNMYIHFFGFTEKTASNPTVATLIFLSVLLTGLGVYDNIGQYAGAGSAVPVTGFANSIASAAIEHRSEGLVLGVGGNMFKLAGSVIVFGVVAAFVAGVLKSLYHMFF